MNWEDTFNLVKKAGSLAAKLSAMGMTGFGLKQIWQDAHDPKSISTKITLSTAYAMHMTTTTLATTAFFHAGPVSPPVATALVGVSSLFMNYASLKETNQNRAQLEKKYRRHHSKELEEKLKLEQFEQKAKKKSLNITTLCSILALLLCWLPSGDTSYLISTLMLGCGMVGSVSGFLDFYKKQLMLIEIDPKDDSTLRQAVLFLNEQMDALQLSPDESLSASAFLSFQPVTPSAPVKLKNTPRPSRRRLRK